MVCKTPTDPSFHPPQVLFPVPGRPGYPGLVHVAHRVSGGPRVASWRLVTAAGWRDAFQLVDALADYPLRLRGFTREATISPKSTIIPPSPTFRSPAMIDLRRPKRP